MKNLILVLILPALLIGCSNPLGDGKTGSQLDDAYRPGLPDSEPVIQKPTDDSNPNISAGSNANLTSSTLSAEVKIRNKKKDLKGNNISAEVSIK